jgi:hypothetical protein
MCLGILLPDLDRRMLIESPSGSSWPSNKGQAWPIFKHDTIQYCVC